MTQCSMDTLVQLHVCRRSDPFALQGESGEVPEPNGTVLSYKRYSQVEAITFRFNFVITLSVAIKYCCK